MAYRESPISEEESISERDYLTSVLNVVNGYCKVNLEVPQTILYRNNSLLPINAKCITLNNTIDKSQIRNTSDNLTNMLNNLTNIKVDESMEYSDFTTSQLSNKMLTNEFLDYSKPSYSEYFDTAERKDIKKNVTFREKKKKNKYNKIDIASTSTDNPNFDSFSGFMKNQNVKPVFAIDKFAGAGLREQELQKKQIKYSPSTSKSQQSNDSENVQNNVSQKSQCPLCFKFFPTPVIEAHASGCSI